MFRTFLRVFCKNLLRQKLIAFINVLGLTLGLSVFIMLMLYVEDEYSWDRQWQHPERLVRLLNTSINGDNTQTIASGPAIVMTQMLEDFSGHIEAASRRLTIREQYMDIDGAMHQNRLLYVDRQFLDLFDLSTVSGNLKATLEAPFRVALTEEDAERYFGAATAVGKRIPVTGKDGVVREHEITAVFRKPAGNTVAAPASFTLLHEGMETGMGEKLSAWSYPSEYTEAYFLLKAGADLAELNARMDAFVDRYMPAAGERKASSSTRLRLQRLTDAHFNPDMDDDGGDLQQVGIFAAIAVLVLLIGVGNYLILATAQSVDRKREIGVKKAAGATTGQLLRQFIGESLLYSTAAMLLALMVIELALPVFSGYLGHQLALRFDNVSTLLLLGVLTLAVGVLGGTYPGLVLSRYRPERVLRRGDEQVFGGSLRLRSLLLGFQFTIAIGMMVATLVLYFQLDYLRSRDPGFRPDNIVAVTGFNSGLGQQLTAGLQQEICALPGVGICTLASRWVNSRAGIHPNYTYTRTQGDDGLLGLDGASIGFDFMDLYQIPLLAGRNFDPQLDVQNPETGQLADSAGAGPDKTRVILNLSATRALGFASAEDAVGQLVYSRNSRGAKVFYLPQEIIGVVADNQLLSLREKPKPLSYVLTVPRYAFFIQAQVAPDQVESFRLESEAIWQRMGGQSSLYFEFAENNVNTAFKQEELEGKILLGAALLAILLSCLGLYGIVLFELRQRTKEIGIRKVLGSSVISIAGLFAWQFSKPVLMANLFAWPFALWAMLQWLQRFPYQIDYLLVFSLCPLAGLLALLIAVLTVSSTTTKAARARPILSLRYE